jgi:hypothetical protein
MHEKQAFRKKKSNYFYFISDFLLKVLGSYQLSGVPPEILTLSSQYVSTSLAKVMKKVFG